LNGIPTPHPHSPLFPLPFVPQQTINQREQLGKGQADEGYVKRRKQKKITIITSSESTMTIHNRVWRKLVVLLLLAASVTTTKAVSRKVQTRWTREQEKETKIKGLTRGQIKRQETEIERELLRKGM